MCCLRYEHETYEDAIKRTPPVGSTVKTADGVGTVTETKPLAEEIRVKIGDGDKDTAKLYKIRDVKVLKTPGRHSDRNEDEEGEEE